MGAHSYFLSPSLPPSLPPPLTGLSPSPGSRQLFAALLRRCPSLPSSPVPVYHLTAPSPSPGSRQLFAALLRRCEERHLVAVCRLVSRRNDTPHLVVLQPQPEQSEDGVQTAPPGFHVIFVPFAGKTDDQRLLRDVPRVVIPSYHTIPYQTIRCYTVYHLHECVYSMLSLFLRLSRPDFLRF